MGQTMALLNSLTQGGHYQNCCYSEHCQHCETKIVNSSSSVLNRLLGSLLASLVGSLLGSLLGSLVGSLASQPPQSPLSCGQTNEQLIGQWRNSRRFFSLGNPSLVRSCLLVLATTHSVIHCCDTKLLRSTPIPNWANTKLPIITVPQLSLSVILAIV